MSNFTKLMGNVIGKRRYDSGRGMKWMYPLTDTGDMRMSQQELDDLIERSRQQFDGWLLTRQISSDCVIKDVIFVVRSKRGIPLGSYQLYMNKPELACIIVNYVEFDNSFTEESLHEFNRNYEGMISYEKLPK